ncbi:hypothetical protein JCM10213v2_006017 [Rhodosporidiobolus nylandii]
MELFLAGVAHSATELDVVEALQHKLHPPYGLSSAPTNFSVNVFTNRSRYNGKLATNANVTIADAALGRLFLQNYGAEQGAPRGPLVIRGRPVRILKSKREADPARVRELQTNPFVSPAVERQKEAELKLLKTPIPLLRLEFGRLEKEGVAPTFSSSYTRSLTGGQLEVDGEKRLMIIYCGAGQPLVHVPIHSITRLQHLSGSTSVLVTLAQPPSFLTSQTSNNPYDLSSLLQALNVPLKNRRLQALDENHARVSPFSSHHLLLVFPSTSDVEQFKHRRTDALRLPKVQPIRLAVTAAPDVGTLSLLKGRLVSLDIRVAFQLELLLHNGILSPKQVSSLVSPAKELAASHGPDQTERILSRFASGLARSQTERMKQYEHGWFEEEEDDYPSVAASKAKPFGQLAGGTGSNATPSTSDLVAQLEHVANTTPPLPQRALDETVRLHFGRHAILTPSGMRLEGPIPDESNALLRQFPEHLHHFVRVSVRDEDVMKISQNDRNVDTAGFLRNRFRPIFAETGGLKLCGREFSFLGYSQSALKEHSAFFLAPFFDVDGKLVTAASIRASLGDFTKVIDIPARYMARLAQAFTATRPSLTLDKHQILAVADIERNGSCFTDGVGTISPALAAEVEEVLKASRPDKRKKRVKATCYQFRLGGAKGMLSIDPLLRGKVICLRPSQVKFASENRTLDIAEVYDGPRPCYLNRPLIKTLEDLGVEPDVLLDLQTEAAEAIGDARSSFGKAASMLERVGLGHAAHLSSTLHNLASLLNSPASDVDPFLNACVDVAIADALRSLKFKARIPVPDSYTLVGVADEDGYLNEGEIYACIHAKGKSTVYISGEVCISRSPTIHPGDVQVVRAVGALPPGVAPRLQGLTNCVVFSTKGARSLPSCLGGGGLDGDLFGVITLEGLMPTTTYVPAAYAPPVMRRLGRPATIADGADFFLEYVLADIMGMVASRHLHIADYCPEGSLHPDCISLAVLHSTAVDYPKTGQPVRFDQLPKAPSQLKPNFMALGRLFRAIPLKDTSPRPWYQDSEALDPSGIITKSLLDLTFESVKLPYLPRQSSPELREEMQNLLVAFCPEMYHIARTHTLSKRTDRHLSEVEVFLSTIASPAKNPRQRSDLVSRLELVTRELFDVFMDEIAGVYSYDEDVEPAWQVERAWAAWQVAVEGDGTQFGGKSFGFLALSLLLRGAKRMNGEEDA